MRRVKVLSAVLLALWGAGGGAPAQQPDPGPVRLKRGDVPLGSLGYPLGSTLTVEGVRPDARREAIKVSAETLRVDTVNGKKLAEPVLIPVANVAALPEGARVVLKGYETGRMFGPVPAAMDAAEAKGGTVLLPQAGWGWQPSFVALAAVRPRLEIREEPKGFKTQGEMKEEKGR